jgi:hypothetical protein
MAKKPMSLIFAGDAPPAWGVEGAEMIANQFGRKYDITLLVEPNYVQSPSRDGEWVLPPDWQQAIDDVRAAGIRTEDITQSDGICDEAASVAARTSKHPVTAREIRGAIRSHMQQGAQIAAKDTAVYAALAARGGVVMDLTVRKRADDPQSLRALGMRLQARGSDKDLHVGSTYGIKVPATPGGFMMHDPSVDSHIKWDHMGENAVDIQVFENFVFAAEPRGRKGEISQGNKFFATALNANVGFVHGMVAKDRKDGLVSLVKGSYVSDIKIASMSPNARLARLYSHDNPERRHEIGSLSIRALNHAVLTHIADRKGKLPDSFHDKAVLPVVHASASSSGRTVHVGQGLEKEYKNSWDPNKANAVNPGGRTTRQDVATSSTHYQHFLNGGSSSTFNPATTYPTYSYPAPGASHDSSPTASLSDMMGDMRLTHSAGDSPTSYSPTFSPGNTYGSGYASSSAAMMPSSSFGGGYPAMPSSSGYSNPAGDFAQDYSQHGYGPSSGGSTADAMAKWSSYAQSSQDQSAAWQASAGKGKGPAR